MPVGNRCRTASAAGGIQ